MDSQVMDATAEEFVQLELAARPDVLAAILLAFKKGDLAKFGVVDAGLPNDAGLLRQDHDYSLTLGGDKADPSAEQALSWVRESLAQTTAIVDRICAHGLDEQHKFLLAILPVVSKLHMRAEIHEQQLLE